MMVENDFGNLELAESFFSGTPDTDLVGDFYEPVLTRAVTYDRVAGYFSSAALVSVSKGIAGFVRNGGKLRLVTSHAFTGGDVAALQDFIASENFNEDLISSFVSSAEELVSLNDAILNDHFAAMCWMLANGHLEIKVVIPIGADLTKLTPQEIEKFHPKFGILSDLTGNKIAFSGSVNETYYAWTRNTENLDVYQSWLPGRDAYIKPKEMQFKKYWDGEDNPEWITVSLPDAVREKIIADYAPDEFPASLKEIVDQPKPFGLTRSYQAEAVQAWLDNEMRGILEMATGTGKTRTAKACIEEASKQGSLLTVVVVPYNHIGSQWLEELSHTNPLMVAGKWRESLGDKVFDAQLGRLSRLTLVVVKNTASKKDFIRLLSDMSDHFDNTLLVGDEVHWLGAPSLQSALLDFADFRLGLSATPQRYFDDFGTEVLDDYFEGVVFKFSIEDALKARDDNGNRILTPYSYHPVFVELTEEESEAYWKITRQILAIKEAGKKDPIQQKKLEELYLYRANIGKVASQKVPRLMELLASFPLELKKTLIYCADYSQMRDVTEILGKFDVYPQKITGEEGTAPKAQFNLKSERQHILDHFGSGNLDVLLAIDCLDEGVDIPSARIGIILASSGNAKEFVQRRGRLMRISPGKESAAIYDLCILPKATSSSGGIRNLIEVELRRIEEFAEVALNKQEVHDLVKERLEQVPND
jgi:superfamily II DNA or RNA helicase